MYEAAKKSLLKFKGSASGVGGSSSGDIPAIKVEPAFYSAQGSRNSGWRGGRRGGSVGNRSAGVAQREKEINPVGRDGHVMRCNKCNSIRHLFVKCPHKGQSRLNPIGRDGKPLPCDSCESRMHFLAKCPHKWPDAVPVFEAEVLQAEEDNEMPESELQQEMPEEVYTVVFLAGAKVEEVTRLNKESEARGLLDTGCRVTVSGKGWLDSYLETLSAEEKQLALKSRSDSSKVFKFGNDELLKSLGRYRIPVILGGKPTHIHTEVVNSSVPLLLSLSLIKSLGGIINTQEDTINLMGENIPMELTSSGLYGIPVGDIECEVLNAVCLDEMGEDECSRRLLKLHRQFGHPSLIKLKKLLQDAHIWDDRFSTILGDIYKTCRLCKEFSSTPPKPAVCLPMAKSFNECVAMDLKHWRDGVWILYIIDVFTRYTMAQFITRKKPEVIVEALIKNWIKVFGVMTKIITDNGGEFNAEEMREVATILDFFPVTQLELRVLFKMGSVRRCML